MGVDDTIRATVRLTNTGSRPALETVQVYVSDLVTSVTWAEQELKAYRQVTVPAGRERHRSSSSCRPPTARWSPRTPGGWSSPASSSCGSGPTPATCSARASGSSPDRITGC